MSNNPPPLSPRRYLCDLDYSKLNEKLNKLEVSPKHSNSLRDENRFKWIQLIVKLNKNRSMQPLYKYLKDESFIQSVYKFRTRIYFKKMQREVLRRKWLRLKSQVVSNYRTDRFDTKAIKVRSVRIKQTSLVLTSNNTDYFSPDFTGLLNLSISPSLEPIHSLRGEGPFEGERESIQERGQNIENITKEEKKKNIFLRKEALKLYCFFILIGLIIGYILYRLYHQKLYSFLKMKDSDIQQMTLLPKTNDSSFTDIKGPSQNTLLQDSTAEVNKVPDTD